MDETQRDSIGLTRHQHPLFTWRQPDAPEARRQRRGAYLLVPLVPGVQGRLLSVAAQLCGEVSHACDRAIGRVIGQRVPGTIRQGVAAQVHFTCVGLDVLPDVIDVLVEPFPQMSLLRPRRGGQSGQCSHVVFVESSCKVDRLELVGLPVGHAEHRNSDCPLTGHIRPKPRRSHGSTR